MAADYVQYSVTNKLYVLTCKKLYTVFRPIVFAWNSASWAMAENELWACTTVMRSLTNTQRSSGKLCKQVVAVDWLYITCRGR